MLVLLDDSLLALIDIHTLPGGLALQLAAAEVEPALGAVEVDGVNHRSNARGLAIVVTLVAVGIRLAAILLVFLAVGIELVLRG